MINKSIYEEIGIRSGGDIYIGVVGPVRTGKSTFVISSRLIYAPSSFAFLYSSAGVTLEENIISEPVNPHS